MMEETGKSYLVAWACILKFSGAGQVRGLERIQHAQFSGPRQDPILRRIQPARRAWIRAESVYSKNQSPGQDLGRWRIQYTRIFRGQGRLPIWSVYKKFEKSGPGQNLYTQIFRIQVRILVVGVYSILEFFRAGKAPDLERIQKARKVRALGRTCILKNSGSGQVPGPERIQKARKAWAESVYSNFQDPGKDLSRWRIQYTRIFRGRADSRSGAYTNKLEKPGSGQNQYTQIFRARADSRSGAYTKSSKSPGPGRISILKFSGSR